MDPDCPALSLTPAWKDDQFFLVRAVDAIRLCRDGGYGALEAVEARWALEAMRRRMREARGFVARAHLTSFPLSSMEDSDVIKLIANLLDRRNLTALRVLESSAASGKTAAETARLHRLVREIESKMRGRLSHSGRQYKLVVDVGLARLPDRDSYQVVGHDEGRQVLEALAKQPGTSADVRTLLGEAGEALSRDWRPPLQADGLVLLRKIVTVQASSSDLGQAITPSQMKKLVTNTDWIEIEVVDQDGLPYTGGYRLVLPDGASGEGRFDEAGFLGNYDLESGDCKLSLLDQRTPKGSGASPTEAPESETAEPEAELGAQDAPPAPTAEVAPFKLRLKLLDLAGNPITGTAVTVAGSDVTTDGDGMVETEVAQGPGTVAATLPEGGVALNLGGLNPRDDSSDDGFRARLFNMGFLWDTNADENGDEWTIALQDFQAQYKVAMSGQLDDATKAKLIEVYGC